MNIENTKFKDITIDEEEITKDPQKSNNETLAIKNNLIVNSSTTPTNNLNNSIVKGHSKSENQSSLNLQEES